MVLRYPLSGERLSRTDDLARQRDRKDYLYERTGVDVMEPHFPTKFLDTLTHTGNADANASGAKLNNVFAEPFAIVANGDSDFAVGFLNNNRSFVSSRVAENVGEPFLNDAKDCGLELRLKTRKLGRPYVDRSFNTTPL